MEATKHANALPAGGDWNFYNAYESFSRLMNNEGNEIMNSVNNILRKYEVDGNIKNRSIEEQTELIVEANDVILENVANNIDEMNGIKKTSLEPVVMQTVSAQLPINGSWNSINRATFSVTSSNSVVSVTGILIITKLHNHDFLHLDLFYSLENREVHKKLYVC